MQRAVVIATSLPLLLALGSCSTYENDVVFVGTPHRRFDHSRTVPVREWTYERRGADRERREEPLVLDATARDETYTPLGHRAFPKAAVGGGNAPSAHLVPLYTGISLPLGDVAPAQGSSDRDDLIDFLGAGPAARVGLERGETAGELPERVVAQFTVLRLLASAELLRDRGSVLAWAQQNGLSHSFDIRDSRYEAGSFADRVALKQGSFWFILFAMPGSSSYSRLVVVPATGLRQSPDKVLRPGGDDGTERP
jgi:hypothetical protein